MAKKQELDTAGLRETRRRVRQAEENLRQMRAAQDSKTNYAQTGDAVGRLSQHRPQSIAAHLRDGPPVPATPVTPTRIAAAQRELRNARAQWRRQQAVAISREERRPRRR